MDKPRPALGQIEEWLSTRHGSRVQDLHPLPGGFWSSAYAYRAGDESLVLRLGDGPEGFAIDQAAMRFAAPDLPVPVVVDTGRALGACFAISRRHHGRFIEDLPAAEAPRVRVALGSLLAALRRVPSSPRDAVLWYELDRSAEPTWREWLRAGLEDRDRGAVTSGWRVLLARMPRADAVFRRCEARILELLPACPERRDLVHGDLLHQNVLVAPDDAARVTAVFSWKCSVRGDFLFDVAWCTFWGPWHPVIEQAGIWNATLAASDVRAQDLVDAGLRHHCYELHTAASHLGWYAWTGNETDLTGVMRACEALLERGPLVA